MLGASGADVKVVARGRSKWFLKLLDVFKAENCEVSGDRLVFVRESLSKLTLEEVDHSRRTQSSIGAHHCREYPFNLLRFRHFKSGSRSERSPGALGLGDATRVERINVRWPDGQVETIRDIPADQIVTVTDRKGMTGRSAFNGR